MRRHPLTRTLAALLVGVSAVPAGCAAPRETDRAIVVLGPWLDNGPPGQDDERDPFRRVLDRYEEDHDVTINYEGTRAIGQALRSAVQNGTPPDIVIMPNVGDLAYYAREGISEPLGTPDGTTAPTLPSGGLAIDNLALWHRPTDGGTEAYAVMLKTDLKSAFWYRPADLAGQDVPRTWPDLLALTGTLAGTGRAPLCLGMSAPSAPGWPGTDWVEDLLLHRAGPDAYQRWVSGELPWATGEVAAAWNAWADLLRSRPVAAAQPRQALLTSFGDAGDALMRGECGLFHQGSFIAGTYDRFPVGDGTAEPGADYAFFPTPAAGAGPTEDASEVSADFAALLTDHPAAAALLRHLHGSEARDTWVAESNGAIFGPDVDPAHDRYDMVGRAVATELRDGGRLCLDASDAMPAALSSAFHQAVLEQVADPDRDSGPLLRELDTLSATDAVAADRLRLTCTD
ncbi:MULTISPECIES: ABC transporter substrate-binding protein [Catenuloplanes]|uniref:Alpha-glucoside transport system substrate-binding protein n=1 Tax=Catenuloplanes niger TaxID=587534 RepID=A0AAE4CXS1_9ACTN|nr:extracellular solute-binding protein [Catenuloplanes niger]MDR7327777.1 alpha-glucoside transport system substrate-binding protein [Catenuloplanes niger]